MSPGQSLAHSLTQASLTTEHSEFLSALNTLGTHYAFISFSFHNKLIKSFIIFRILLRKQYESFKDVKRLLKILQWRYGRVRLLLQHLHSEVSMTKLLPSILCVSLHAGPQLVSSHSLHIWYTRYLWR